MIRFERITHNYSFPPTMQLPPTFGTILNGLGQKVQQQEQDEGQKAKPDLYPESMEKVSEAHLPSEGLTTPSDNPTEELDLTHLKNVANYHLIETVGTGNFARVWLVKPKNGKEGQVYALKVIRKSAIIKSKQVEHVLNERAILERCRSHPFITTYITSWRDWGNLYILLDYCPGGEIFSYLQKNKRLPLPVARFYAAELVTILAFLHDHGIVYRDLKPENTLIDQNGHIRLVDFGFAKYVGERETYTICGTPEYIAPEVVKSGGHGKAVDWWGLGIFIYELCCGYPPFHGESPMAIYKSIIEGRIEFPKHITESTKDIISRLCTKDRTARLGNLVGGSSDVVRHPFFFGIDWEELLAKRNSGPLIPSLKGAEDTSYFDKYPPQEAHDPEDYTLTMYDKYERFFEDF